MTIAEHTEAEQIEAASAEVEPAETPPIGSGRRSRRRVLVIAAVVTVALLAVIGGSVLALRKTVTVTVDGESMSVTMLAGTVQGALSAAGLVVAEHDTLAPAAGARVSDGNTIVLNRGRHVTLTVDGQPISLWTTARTVEAAMIELGRNPGGYQLSADRSRPIPLDGLALSADTLYRVTVADRGIDRSLTTTSMTVSRFLTTHGITLGANDRVTPDLTSTISGARTVTIITLPTVTVLDGSSPGQSIVSGAADVGGLLAAAGIVLGPQDVVSVPLTTAPTEGLQVGITRISTTQISELVQIEQPADQTVEDAGLLKGNSDVAQQGQAGQAEVTYDVVTTNGVESSRTETGRTTTVEPLPTITHVGTKVAAPKVVTAPAAPAAPAPAAAAAPVIAAPVVAEPVPTEGTNPPVAAGSGVERVGNQVFFHDTEFGVNWDGLAHCESTNNPRAINPSGKYTGLFQFDDQTWRSVGGSGRAYDASPEEQLMRAKLLFQSRGLSPWACAWAA